MFLIKVNEEVVATWKKDVLASSEAEAFYEALKAKRYEIYFSYSQKDQTILYEALPLYGKDQYHSLLVSIDRSLKSIGRSVPTPFSKAFASYLHESECAKTEAELKQIYGPYYNDIEPLANMSYEDALDRQSMMPLFRELSSALLAYSKNDYQKLSDQKLFISYEIKPQGDGQTFEVRLKAGIDKVRVVKNSLDFLSKYKMGGEIEFYRDYLRITPEMIADADKDVLLILLNENVSNRGQRLYYSTSDAILMDKKGICSLLFALADREVEYDGKTYRVDSHVLTPKISILSDGTFAFEPEIKGELFFSGNKGAMIHPTMRIIALLSFASDKEASVYRFCGDHPEFRFDLFQNEIANSLVPLLDQQVSVAEEFSVKHPSRKEEIRYYVTYTEKDELEFRTELINDSIPVDELTFLSHPVGESKYGQFKSALDFLELPMTGTIKDSDQIMAFLKMDLMPIKNCATIYLSENLSNKKVTGVGKINIRMKSGIDWLEMELGSDIYTDEELELILSAYKKKKKYVRLNQSFISFEDENSKTFTDLVDEFDVRSLQTSRLPIYDALKLSSYGESELSVLYSKEIKDLFEDIRSFPKEEISLDLEIQEQLRPYQLDGVKWLHVLTRHNLSGILADDMGLGKTLEMIALLSLSEVQKPILIVSPKSLIYNWEYEFRKWNRHQQTIVIDGDKACRNVTLSTIDPNKKDVYITSYDSLRNDLDAFEKISFSYMVLDEGQNIANVYAKKTRAVKEVQADHKFVLTGTPIQNSLMDLWSIFDFLMPGYLPSYASYYHLYGKTTIDNEDEKELLMKKVMPFVLKRTKADVLKDLPPKETQVLHVGMSTAQRELYDAYLQRTRQEINGGNFNKIAILAEITRLREICVDPSMFIENFTDASEKLTAAVETIKTAINSGHKVLVFSTFAKTLFHLTDLLKAEELPSSLIYGETKAKDRLMLADQFNNTDDIKIMLVSLKAGGTGLNLIGADIVIHLDPWWNLAAENQASDRAHRIGQTRPVTVLKMVCRNSIEERVIELQELKKELASVITEGDEGITNIDTKDLRFLLE